MPVDKVRVLETGGSEIVCVVVGCGSLQWEGGGETLRSASDLLGELKQEFTLTLLMEYNRLPTAGAAPGRPPVHLY